MQQEDTPETTFEPLFKRAGSKQKISGTDLQVEMRPIDLLIPYSRNARTHSDEQVAQIAASIHEFGWTNPILIDGINGVIAGHGRLLAARKLGMAEVPVIELRNMTEAQKRAYVIADNKLAENAGWDQELLRIELQELKAIDFNIDLIGFDSIEMKEILFEPPGEDRDPDAVPEAPEKPISKKGDIWLLGEHRVLCGDSTKADEVAQLMDGVKADMCFTDPPYNVRYGESMKDHLRNKCRVKVRHAPIRNDDLGENFGEFLSAACTNILSVTNGAVYIAMSSSELDTLQEAFRKAGGKWSTFVIWTKNTFTLGRSDYQRMYEPILYGWRDGTDHYWCGARDQGDVWQVNKPHRNDLHPTMKPVELVERAIRNSSQIGEIVLDPFAGAGSTVIAAEKTGRRCYAIEIDPKYVDVIVRRWQEYTGKKAIHGKTGKVFGEI